jgi:predicted RNase H-like HicB family nuclease
MRYPVVIESGDETTAFGVIVPDLPGCFSAGDTLDEAMAGVEEAAAAWIDATLDASGALSAPSSLDALRLDPAWRGWAFGVVSLNPTYSGFSGGWLPARSHNRAKTAKAHQHHGPGSRLRSTRDPLNLESPAGLPAMPFQSEAKCRGSASPPG